MKTNIVRVREFFSGKRKYLIISFLLALLLTVIVATTYYISNNRSQPTATKQGYAVVCNEELIKRASFAIEKNNLADLAKIKDEIIKLPEYERDHNCLYILARNGSLRSDSKEIQKYLIPLKKVYVKEFGYSRAFTVPTMTPEDFESSLRFIEKSEDIKQAQMEQNQKSMSDTLNKLEGTGSQ